MTYLHDKNIVHGRLTSVNIYIELNQRVKISLIDDDETPIVSNLTVDYSSLETKTTTTTTTHGHSVSPDNRQSGVAFDLAALTYLSPELVKSIQVGSTANADNHLTGAEPRNNCDTTNNRTSVYMDTNKLTQKSDIYSFGTVLFELFEGKFPFATKPKVNGHSLPQTPVASITNSPSVLNTPRFTSSSPVNPLQTSPRERSHYNNYIKLTASQLIYQIGSGQIVEKNPMVLADNQGNLAPGSKCPPLVKSYICACWSREPNERPTFKQLAFDF